MISRTINLGVVLAFSATPIAALASDTFLFDADGAGGNDPILVSSFDWKVGNALALGTLPLPPAPAFIPSTLLTHASLNNFLNSSASPILGTGLNSAFEITFIGGAAQVGTSLGSNATFAFDSSAQPNFFEIYWDPANNSSDLTGEGFADGRLILSGIISAYSATYLITSLTPIPLDQFINNDYPNTNTISGSGGGTVFVDVLFADPEFFPDPEKQPKTLSFNTSQVTPYFQADPSAKFYGNAGAGSPNIVPDLGATNGNAADGGTDVQFQADANMSMTLEAIVAGACRMTGGGVTVDGEVLLDENGSPVPTAQAHDQKNRYTFGGQVGAPTAAQPEPMGEWTHHQFQGPAGDFVFRVGTASAPKDTFVALVTCADPGFCNPARPAPFKQLNWEGIGSFRNAKGAIAGAVNAENDKQPGYSRHYVRVHIEDLGEPGGNGEQKGTNCTHVIGSLIGDPASDADAAAVCSSCADVYQIEIHATEAPDSAVIYSAGGYIDSGNLQIHPEIK